MPKITTASVSFEVARLRALQDDNWPYLGMALLALAAHKQPACPTAAIDEWWRVYYSPDFVASLTAQQAAAVFVHEVWHPLRLHFVRARLTGVTRETATLWNWVIDAEIHNGDEKLLADLRSITHNGKKLEPITVESFDPPLDPRLTAEAWYLDVMSRQSTKRHVRKDGSVVYLPKLKDGYPDPDDFGGQIPGFGGGHASGSTGLPAPWEFPSPHADVPGERMPPGIDLERSRVIQAGVAEAIRQHVQRCGSGAAGLTRFADEVLSPKVDWRTQFAAYFQGVMAPVCGTEHWTWRKPSRRQAYDPRIVLPGRVGSVRRVAVIVDTSGSMSDTMLSRCRAEITQMVGTLATNGREPAVAVYTCDTAVSEAQKVWTGADVQMIGGGGTDITRAFDKVTEDMSTGDFQFDIVVCMTDGFTPWPKDPYPVPVVTMLVSSGAHPEWLDRAPHHLIRVED